MLRSSPARALVEAHAPDSAEHHHLDLACHEAVAACRPATLADIVTTLERLALHYPQLRRTDAEARLVIRDWAQDLTDYPADLIAEAARLWRNSTAERYPTPGQLKALVAGMWDHRQRLGRRAQEWLCLVAAGGRGLTPSARAAQVAPLEDGRGPDVSVH